MKAFIDKWEEWDFRCQSCGWQEKGSQLKAGEIFESGCEELCPACGESVSWLEFPLADEVLAHPQNVPPADLAVAVAIYKGHKSWHASKLQSADQLPDIDSEEIVLDWTHDSKTGEIVIRHGEREIFRQEGSWEYYDFFVTACRILKAKYAWRLRDVVPTRVAKGNMCGDKLTADISIDEMRRLIALDCLPPQAEMSTQARQDRERWKTYRLDFE